MDDRAQAEELFQQKRTIGVRTLMAVEARSVYCLHNDVGDVFHKNRSLIASLA